jgi:hypothetical protein
MSIEALRLVPQTRKIPLHVKTAPRWWLRLRAWCLRRRGLAPLRAVTLRSSAPADPTSAELRALEHALLELNLKLERARCAPTPRSGKPGLAR